HIICSIWASLWLQMFIFSLDASGACLFTYFSNLPIIAYRPWLTGQATENRSGGRGCESKKTDFLRDLRTSSTIDAGVLVPVKIFGFYCRVNSWASIAFPILTHYIQPLELIAWQHKFILLQIELMLAEGPFHKPE
ncbi:hypothetical protein ACJX0J_035269, partial [Zea mays]